MRYPEFMKMMKLEVEELRLLSGRLARGEQVPGFQVHLGLLIYNDYYYFGV